MKLSSLAFLGLLVPVSGTRRHLLDDPSTLLCRCEADNENLYPGSHRALGNMDYSSAKLDSNGLLVIGGVTVVPRATPICTQYALSLLERGGKE